MTYCLALQSLKEVLVQVNRLEKRLIAVYFRCDLLRHGKKEIGAILPVYSLTIHTVGERLCCRVA
jgi:hypothetical protein